MKDILEFFKGIATAITTLIDFVIDMISDLVYVVGLLGEFVVQIPSYFSWLPGAAVALIVTIFAIVVIYKIIGREG